MSRRREKEIRKGAFSFATGDVRAQVGGNGITRRNLNFARSPRYVARASLSRRVFREYFTARH